MVPKILTIGASILLLTSCLGQPPKITNQQKYYCTDTISFSIDTNVISRDYNHLLCDVDVNGLKVGNVLIDNGCRYMVLHSELASLLDASFVPFDSSLWTSLDVRHGYCEGYLAQGLVFNIGHTAYAVDTVEISDRRSIFRKSNIRAIIGRDFFENYVVELDFKNNIMIFGNQLPAKTDDYLAIPMEPCGGPHLSMLRVIKVDGFKQKNGRPMQARLCLDLGCGETSYDETFLHCVDQHFSQLDTTSMAYLVMNTIGVAIDSVGFPCYYEEKSGKRVRTPGPSAKIIGESLKSDILLGNNFFSHFNVIFDYKNNMLYLKRNE